MYKCIILALQSLGETMLVKEKEADKEETKCDRNLRYVRSIKSMAFVIKPGYAYLVDDPILC